MNEEMIHLAAEDKISGRVQEGYERGVAEECERFAPLLAAVNAVFDVEVKHAWRILSPEAAERFAALQRIANEITSSTRPESPSSPIC